MNFLNLQFSSLMGATASSEQMLSIFSHKTTQKSQFWLDVDLPEAKKIISYTVLQCSYLSAQYVSLKAS